MDGFFRVFFLLPFFAVFFFFGGGGVLFKFGNDLQWHVNYSEY